MELKTYQPSADEVRYRSSVQVVFAGRLSPVSVLTVTLLESSSAGSYRGQCQSAMGVPPSYVHIPRPWESVLLTVGVKKLARAVPVHANVGVQPHDLPAPVSERMYPSSFLFFFFPTN